MEANQKDRPARNEVDITSSDEEDKEILEQEQEVEQKPTVIVKQKRTRQKKVKTPQEIASKAHVPPQMIFGEDYSQDIGRLENQFRTLQLQMQQQTTHILNKNKKLKEKLKSAESMIKSIEQQREEALQKQKEKEVEKTQAIDLKVTEVIKQQQSIFDLLKKQQQEMKKQNESSIFNVVKKHEK